VRDGHAGDVGMRHQVVLQPGYVVSVQMIGRLIQKENISLQQHGAC
jgi:hypothetical protein